jgi:RNA recognition motif-containing protein
MTNIYVGNLSFDVSDAQLQGAFAAFGTVNKASVVTDRMTGRSRGFGFVEMAKDDEGLKAIEGLNGSELGGRSITVNVAKPKADRDSRGSGGGGGGGGGRDRRW